MLLNHFIQLSQSFAYNTTAAAAAAAAAAATTTRSRQYMTNMATPEKITAFDSVIVSTYITSLHVSECVWRLGVVVVAVAAVAAPVCLF